VREKSADIERNRKALQGPLATIYGEQIRHHLSSYCNRCSIGVSFLFCPLVDQRELVAVSRRQFGDFHKHTLNMLIALFGERSLHHLIC
jgi:hypothetical protein